MDSVPVTPHTITSADVIQDTTPVDKYESLECRVLSVQQDNEHLLTCYQYVDCLFNSIVVCIYLFG